MTIAAIRHNNPGDVSLPIRGWTGGGKIVGLRGQSGYAEFPTMKVGYEAFLWRLREYIAEGRDTIRAIGRVYATDPKWSEHVAELAGLHLDQAIGEGNIGALAEAIIRQETGMTLEELSTKAAEFEKRA